MQQKKYLWGLILFLSAPPMLRAQFNTLSPQVQPEKKKYERYTIVENTDVVAEKKMQSGLWHKLFGRRIGGCARW